MTNTNPILVEPLMLLSVSTEFMEMCEANSFKTLGDILKYPSGELTKKPQFGMRMLKELIELLERYSIEDLLEE